MLQQNPTDTSQLLSPLRIKEVELRIMHIVARVAVLLSADVDLDACDLSEVGFVGVAHEGAETVEVGEKSAASEVVSNGEGVVEVVDSASLIVGGFVGEEDGSEDGVGAASSLAEGRADLDAMLGGED